jgi:hypothetical protein
VGEQGEGEEFVRPRLGFHRWRFCIPRNDEATRNMKGETYGLFSVILAMPLAQVPRSLKFLKFVLRYTVLCPK